MLGFYGAGGLPLETVEHDIQRIQSAIPADTPFGVNFIADIQRPDRDRAIARLCAAQSSQTH